MNKTSLPRTVAAGSLVATAVLSLASNVTAPEFPSGAEDRLAAIDDGGSLAVLSAMTFTLAQLFLTAGILGAAALVHRRRPVLAYLAAGMVVAGTFGHSVFGGINLVMLEMARDVDQRATYAGLLSDVESGPAMVFMAIGLLGTVLGFLVLAIGMWRSRAVALWIPAALAGFVVVEFVGAGISEWAGYAAGVLYVAALSGTALAIACSDVWSAVDRSDTRNGVLARD